MIPNDSELLGEEIVFHDEIIAVVVEVSWLDLALRVVLVLKEQVQKVKGDDCVFIYSLDFPLIDADYTVGSGINYEEVFALTPNDFGTNVLLEDARDMLVGLHYRVKKREISLKGFLISGVLLVILNVVIFAYRFSLRGQTERARGNGGGV